MSLVKGELRSVKPASMRAWLMGTSDQKGQRSMGILMKVALVTLALLGLVYWGSQRIQRHLMYHPDTAHVTPQEAGLPDSVREIILVTDNREQVLAWHAPAIPGQPTLLYFHGNAGSLVTRTARIARYMEQGIGVFMMTYRGFGGSTGQPSEAANVADARLAYAELRRRGVAPEDIILYGESLGTNVAVQTALSPGVEARGIILDAPYTSMLDLANLHYPELPARYLLTDTYETEALIPSLKIPLLIVHGEEDQIVPASMGKRLFERAGSAMKELKLFPLAGHTDHYGFGSLDAILAWISVVRGS